VSERTARSLLQLGTNDNALIITLRPNASRPLVMRQIVALSPSIMVQTHGEVVADHQQVISDAFLPVIAVLLTVDTLPLPGFPSS
jgi:hypothetical protein